MVRGARGALPARTGRQTVPGHPGAARGQAKPSSLRALTLP